jgi:branched-subunit amino acid permease
MDAMASVVFAEIITGWSWAGTRDLRPGEDDLLAGLVSAIGLPMGLMYLGASSVALPASIERTDLLTGITKGFWECGQDRPGLAVALACLTTSIGLRCGRFLQQSIQRKSKETICSPLALQRRVRDFGVTTIVKVAVLSCHNLSGGDYLILKWPDGW